MVSKVPIEYARDARAAAARDEKDLGMKSQDMRETFPKNAMFESSLKK